MTAEVVHVAPESNHQNTQYRQVAYEQGLIRIFLEQEQPFSNLNSFDN